VSRASIEPRRPSAALVAVALAAGCATSPHHGDPSGDHSDTSGPLQVTATIDVGGEADWMGVGFDSLWVPTPSMQLLRIDPASRAITAMIHVGAGTYRGVGIGRDAVFIPNAGDNTISKVDPSTNTVTATFAVALNGDSEGSIGVSDDAVWVVTDLGAAGQGVLSRLSTTDGSSVATIPISPDSHGVVVEGGFVWVTSFGGSSIAQVDPKTNAVVATIQVDAGPRFLTAGGGAVWVMSQSTGRVTRIDSATGAVAAVIDAKTPGPGGDIAFGEGALWVSAFGKPATKIDPATNTVVAQFVQNGFGDAIRAAFGSLWISGSHVFQTTVP
jgi:virginiamycin B lyase